jgi:hypothetical protein
MTRVHQLEDVLRRLVEWDAFMGYNDARVWRDARRLLEKSQQQQPKEKGIDPQACLNEMLRAIEQADMVEARRTLADLVNWHVAGELMPDLRIALLALGGADD